MKAATPGLRAVLCLTPPGEIVLHALSDLLLVVSKLIRGNAQLSDRQHDARTPAKASPMHVVCPAIEGWWNDPLLERARSEPLHVTSRPRTA